MAEACIAAEVARMTRLPIGLPTTLQARRNAGMSLHGVDLFDLNKAFASVPVAWLQVTGADPARLNVIVERL